jgi:2'-5' RNA ligase
MYMSVFIATKIPQESIIAIRDVMRSYQDVLVSSVPQEKWHITMLFLGDIELSKESLASLVEPLPQKFHPVIKVLSLGEGKARNQLWAYTQPNQLLDTIRITLIERAKNAGIEIPNPAEQYIPHIHVGTIDEHRQALAVPDAPATTSFSLRELVVFRSNPDALYEQLAIIPVTP